MDFLLSSDPLAQRLRQYFVFKLVPMLNPDGVVVGNYRSSLAGVDLNRCWDKPLRDLHPTIFHTRCVWTIIIWLASQYVSIGNALIHGACYIHMLLAGSCRCWDRVQASGPCGRQPWRQQQPPGPLYLGKGSEGFSGQDIVEASVLELFKCSPPLWLLSLQEAIGGIGRTRAAGTHHRPPWPQYQNRCLLLWL